MEVIFFEKKHIMMVIMFILRKIKEIKIMKKQILLLIAVLTVLLSFGCTVVPTSIPNGNGGDATVVEVEVDSHSHDLKLESRGYKCSNINCKYYLQYQSGNCVVKCGNINCKYYLQYQTGNCVVRCGNIRCKYYNKYQTGNCVPM